jgi:hypothetical protein
MSTDITNVNLAGPSTADAPSLTDNSAAVVTSAWVKSLLATVSFPGTISGNGYVILPNGLIIQWGVAAGAGGTGTPVSFPLTFPSAAFTVVVSALQNSGGSSSIFSSAAGLSQSGFHMITVGTPVQQSGWIAIGY